MLRMVVWNGLVLLSTLVPTMRPKEDTLAKVTGLLHSRGHLDQTAMGKQSSHSPSQLYWNLRLPATR